MHEIEIKVLEIDPEQITKKLEVFAKLVADRLLRMQFFVFPPEPQITIRVRSGIKNTLTAKGPQLPGKAKIRKEVEVRVKTIPETIAVLKSLGCRELGPPKEKRRLTYKDGDVLFEIDFFPRDIIPPLLEIEAPSEQLIAEALQRLEIPASRANDFGAARLFLYYGLDFDRMNLRFSAKERAALPEAKEIPWRSDSEKSGERLFVRDKLSVRLEREEAGWMCHCGQKSVLTNSAEKTRNFLHMIGFTEQPLKGDNKKG